MNSPARSVSLLALLWTATATVSLPAQVSFQTLPRGFNSAEGNSSTAFPANTSDDQIFQWHYPAAEFDATGPIRITDVAIRGKAGVNIGPFSFQEWNVTLAEAATGLSSHDSVFGFNFVRSKTCRTGPWSSVVLIPLPGSTVGGNVWMGLTESFVYDPSTGHDLIVQVQKCGTPLAWGTNMDAASGSGGGRFGHRSDCFANAEDFRQSTIVPVVGIRYELATQTLPRGFDSIEGNGSVGWPMTAADDQKWQWHYDVDEFDESGPIAITEVYVRRNMGGGSLVVRLQPVRRDAGHRGDRLLDPRPPDRVQPQHPRATARTVGIVVRHWRR